MNKLVKTSLHSKLIIVNAFFPIDLTTTVNIKRCNNLWVVCSYCLVLLEANVSIHKAVI